MKEGVGSLCNEIRFGVAASRADSGLRRNFGISAKSMRRNTTRAGNFTLF